MKIIYIYICELRLKRGMWIVSWLNETIFSQDSSVYFLFLSRLFYAANSFCIFLRSEFCIFIHKASSIHDANSSVLPLSHLKFVLRYNLRVTPRKRDEEARGSVCLSVWLINIRFMRREFDWPVLGSQWVERDEKVGAGDMTLAIEASLLHSSWHVPEVCSGERCKTSQRTAAMEARNKESVAKNGRKTRRLCLFPDKRNHRVLLIACLRA